ncbi:MAG: epoxide hydrolase [Porticoccaceae bacterium]|nr:epoxide hydrolase [Porticoccaceae bacterium]
MAPWQPPLLFGLIGNDHKDKERTVTDSITPFELSIPQAQLDDLKTRLSLTRWPEKETVDDWSQGAPLAAVKALCDYWQNTYDWRRCEQRLNKLGQFKTTIDGLEIHFLHIRSKHENALPMVMTHGWPGSVIEFLNAIDPLTNPEAHGGKAEDAFHLVIPSLPGFGFSEQPKETGWGIHRIARAWTTLMNRLGYEGFVAQGGDWGAGVTTALGNQKPDGLKAIHLNMPLVQPQPEDMADLTPAEQAALGSMQFYQDWDSGYSKQQATRPQTLGYGLVDSPVGQAAWIYEKFYAWTDNGGKPEDALSYDQMLDNIMLYWLPGNGASSGRLYWESFKDMFTEPMDIPVGVSIFPREIFRPSKRWAERVYKNLIHWNETDKGGHFAAFEQPERFVNEVRTCFRHIR